MNNGLTRAPADDQGHATEVRNGSKVRTVDIHCHIHVPQADDRLSELATEQKERHYGQASTLTDDVNRRLHEKILPQLTDASRRIADMDQAGIDIQAISPSPFYYNYGHPPEVTREISQLVNNTVAEMVAGNPDRFVGMGTVPLQDAQMAVAELDRCVDELGFKGIEISTNVNGTDLTRAGLESFFARAVERDILIFIHPIGTSFTDRMGDHYFNNLIGHPLESALAVGHLIFDGYLDTYSDLKICSANGGGYVPAYAGRLDHPYALREDCRINIDKPPSEYLKMLHFDSVVFTEHQLRYLIETWGADRVLLGTDYPYDMAEPDPVGHIGSVRGLNDADRDLVLGGNAARLLNLE
jgi:aminocarboxymuconate-semialdehyde decarboxylase